MTKKLLFLLFIGITTTAFSQNNYLDFDGVNDNVNIPNSGTAVASANTITLSCKVYPKSATANFPNFDGFAGYRNESTFDFYIIQLSSTQVEARFRNSSGVAYTILYNGLVLNQWNHFFLVYDGTTLNLYSGTTLAGSTAASGNAPATNTSTLKIGLIQFQTFNWYHNGYIDEVSLWDKALSSTEISSIMSNNGEIANPASELNLKLYYKFNQGIPYGVNTTETTLIDEKVTNNGALANFALTGNSSNWGSANLSTSTFNTPFSYVYPNPTSSYLNFSGYSNLKNIKIVDISGRIIITKDILDTELPTVDVNTLSSGMYFALINDTEKIKFIKK